MTYRALLLGCGKIGSEFADDPLIEGVYTHAGAYEAHPATSLVAVCDASPEKAERCALRWGVTHWGTDPVKLLSAVQPDIVSICTPDETHVDLIDAALATPSVRAVFAEKPLATGLDDAQRIKRRAEEVGVVLAVNFIRRYAEGHQALRKQIANGGLGTIYAVNGYYTKGTLHNGGHWFDTARFLIGEIAEVQAWNTLGEHAPDPTLDVRLVFANGACGYLQALDANSYSLFEMDITGSKGRARITDSGHCIELYDVVDSPRYSGYRALRERAVVPGGMENCTFNALADLVRCLESGGAPLCSVSDGLAAIVIGMAARESVQSNRPETIKLD